MKSHHRLRLLFALAASLTLVVQHPALARSSAQPSSIPSIFVDEIKIMLAKQCRGEVAGATGLCLLASKTPRTKGGFSAIQVVNGQPTGPAVPVALNAFVSLSPGAYRITRTSGIDNLAPATVAVNSGAVTTIRTMTLTFLPLQKAKTAFKLQRFSVGQGSTGICAAEFPRSGVHAYLPGNYVLTRPGRNRSQNCERGGVTFNGMAGQSFKVRGGRVIPQAPDEALTYIHPNKISALTSIAPFNHGISKMVWLPSWKLHQAIQNPGTSPRGAIALLGPGNYTYLVPFRFNRKYPKVCGRSLAQGQLPAMDLLTDCTFARGRLTGFTVNRGAYFTYHNLHGLTGISANAINSTFKVQDVKFTLPKGN